MGILKKHRIPNVLMWSGISMLVLFLITNGKTTTFSTISLVLLSSYIVVYINLNYLTPKLYVKRKIVQYILISFGIIAMLFFSFHFYINQRLPFLDKKNPDIKRTIIEEMSIIKKQCPESSVLLDNLANQINNLRSSKPPNLRNERYFNPKKRNTRKPGAAFSALLSNFLLLPPLLVFIGSTLQEITLLANRRQKDIIRLKNEQLQTELQFLKSQLNPHFLFNCLNNIYALTVLNSNKASDNVLKLSNMLRYMMYDCNDQQVPLSKEIEYLKDYITLFSLKERLPLNIESSFDECKTNWQIAPLLFIPFVENAFKHSNVENTETGWVKIHLSCTDDKINFEISNSIPNVSFTKDRQGGIGLRNVQRQLQLMYPNRHSLQILETKETFFVQLKIDMI